MGRRTGVPASSGGSVTFGRVLVARSFVDYMAMLDGRLEDVLAYLGIQAINDALRKEK